MAGNVVVVNSGNFDAEVLRAKGLVLVDFWADGCMPCKMLAPVMEKIAGEYAGRAKVCKLDVDKGQELAGRFGVLGIPAVIFFRNGSEVDRAVGYRPFEEFVISINKNI